MLANITFTFNINFEHLKMDTDKEKMLRYFRNAFSVLNVAIYTFRTFW